MTQEFIGPGKGANGAKPHMVPIGINQGTAPWPVLPQYTLRQEYPNSWINRPYVAKAARTAKTAYYRFDGSVVFQILRANPNRVAAFFSSDGTSQVWIAQTSNPSFSNNAIELSLNQSMLYFDAERFGNLVEQDWWAQGQGAMNFAVIEIFEEPFDPRVTKGLFP